VESARQLEREVVERSAETAVEVRVAEDGIAVDPNVEIEMDGPDEVEHSDEGKKMGREVAGCKAAVHGFGGRIGLPWTFVGLYADQV
jgi:hypothetical protein